MPEMVTGGRGAKAGAGEVQNGGGIRNDSEALEICRQTNKQKAMSLGFV